MELHEIVGKLVGPIEAVGCSQTDKKRLENAEVHGELTVQLVRELVDAAKDKDRHEDSMKQIGKKCDFWLREIREWLPEEDSAA